MRVIAVANQKGGCGKTTITRELSACLAFRGYSVLAIDCDPQGNLTESWLDESLFEYTLANVLIDADGKAKKREHLPLASVIVESPVVNLDLVPSNIKLARFDLQPEHFMHRLPRQIQEHGGRYDLVFIDCPPQLGKLLATAFYSADYVLIPCAATALGLSGLTDLAMTIDEIRENVNPRLKTLGAVINLFKINRTLSAEVRASVEAASGEIKHVFDTNIHDYSKVAEAPVHRKPVVFYAEDHRAADQFWQLTDEICDLLKMPRTKIQAVKS